MDNDTIIVLAAISIIILLLGLLVNKFKNKKSANNKINLDLEKNTSSSLQSDEHYFVTNKKKNRASLVLIPADTARDLPHSLIRQKINRGEFKAITWEIPDNMDNKKITKGLFFRMETKNNQPNIKIVSYIF